MIKDKQVLNWTKPDQTKPNVMYENTETKHMQKETSQAGEERNNKNRKVKESTMKNQDAAFLKTSKKECKQELRVHKSITDSLTWGRSWTNFPKIYKYARHTYTQRHLYEEDFFMFRYITEAWMDLGQWFTICYVRTLSFFFVEQRHHITILSGLEVNSSKSRLCQLGRFTTLICLL